MEKRERDIRYSRQFLLFGHADSNELLLSSSILIINPNYVSLDIGSFFFQFFENISILKMLNCHTKVEYCVKDYFAHYYK